MTLNEALEIHNDVLNKINIATKVSDIPTVGKGDYEKRIKSFFKENNLSSDSLKELVDAIAEGKDESEVQLALMNACKTLNLDDASNATLFDEVNEKITSDPVMAYIAEEIKQREAKIEELIGKNYEDIKVFDIPKHEGEFEGKRFYNCYINKVENLSLDILVGETGMGAYPDDEVEVSGETSSAETQNSEMDLSSYGTTSSASDEMDLSSFSNTSTATPEEETTNTVEEAEPEADLSSFGTSNESTEVVEETVTSTVSSEVVNSEGSKSLLEIQEMINELIKNDNIKEAEFQRAKAEYLEYKKEFKVKLQELNSQITAMITDTDKSLGN